MTAAAFHRDMEYVQQQIQRLQQPVSANEARLAVEDESRRSHVNEPGSLPYLWLPEASPNTPLASAQGPRQTRLVTPATATLMRTIDRRFDMNWAPGRPANAHELHSHPTVAAVTAAVHAVIATPTQPRQAPVAGESLHQLQSRGYRTNDPEEIPHSPNSAVGDARNVSRPENAEQQHNLPRTLTRPTSDQCIQLSIRQLFSFRPALIDSASAPSTPQTRPVAGPSSYARRMALSEFYRPPPSAQDEAFADIARRAAAATAIDTARTWPESAAVYQRLITNPPPEPSVTARDFATRPTRNYATDNESFMSNVRERTEQFATSRRRQPRVRLQRRPNLVEPDRQVYYDLWFGPHRYLGVMSFNWQSDERRAHRQGSSWRSVRVAVDVAYRILGTEVVDQVVFAELWIAVRKEVIGERLAEEIWQGWCGSGGERMVFEMEDRHDVQGV
ncbi:hypothetical protein B0A55_02693 [Friedmanniomyces simplex]|uniref:Uncharacterized protein n=1 Tax=Friedmanniomyces simplex TaxID=329884 RepID=A0A4U0XVR5_9PEZI|nr:hypothetical protein B0A55_02693 [Friedmanniomyces simplex]